MKRKSYTPLRDQEVVMEPRPVTSDQVDGVMNSSDALDVKLEKLNQMRQQHEAWTNRQPETDGRPLMRYIDDAIDGLIQAGDLNNVDAA